MTWSKFSFANAVIFNSTKHRSLPPDNNKSSLWSPDFIRNWRAISFKSSETRKISFKQERLATSALSTWLSLINCYYSI